METVVNYPNPYYRKPDEIEYVRGNCYRTSEGEKVELIWIDPKCGQMLFISPDTRKTIWVNPGNEYIAGPWREAQVCVRMYRHKHTGQVRVWDEYSFLPAANVDSEWILLGGWTLTEGTENP